MKTKSLLMVLLMMAGFAFAQTDTIPLVTAHDINFIPDSLASTWPPSPLVGKTVHVRGTVLVRTRVDPDTNRKPILAYTKALSSYIQAEDGSPWSGLNIYQTDSTVQGTLFDLIDTASTYEFTGVVTTYGQGTELILTTTPQPIPISLVSQQMKRPDPIEVTFDSLYNSDGSFNFTMRKYMGQYVSLKADQLITSDLITSTGSTGGGFKVNDGLGHRVQMYAQSNYFKTGSTYPRLRTGYSPPANGSIIPYIKGLLLGYNSASDGWIWEIVCMYPEDLGAPTLSPPAITNVRRDPAVVAPNTPVTVTCNVVGTHGGYVTKVQLFTRVNGVIDSLDMTKLGTPNPDSTFSAVIPGIASDSAFVDYYIKATDNNSLSSTSPGNLNTSRFSYFVLNRPLTIQDVRYSPFGSGYSGYNGYKVQVTGVVISDTTDIPGNRGTNPSRIYIQNGETPWSGIVLGTNGVLLQQINALKRGDNVTVEGYVGLGAFGNKIDTISTLVVNSSGNSLPAPHVMKTSDVGTFPLGTLSAEPWNGTLVTYKNITIDQRNADTSATNANFGESYCQDQDLGTHTRVIWSDGATSFNAGASAIRVSKGDMFESITGVLGYTHANYKLCPRKNDDIVGYSTGINDAAYVVPTAYKLNQNFPNPFNPSTTISYDLPVSGMVIVKIFNILGQEVKTLVNQNQSAGAHTVSFDASFLNSGVYFYSLSAGEFTQVKKMLLLK